MANNWTTAETNLFNYLLAALGDIENKTAFAAPDGYARANEYLPGFADTKYDYMWTCWFEGGGESADRGPTNSLPYVRGTAYFRGFFKNRDKAREYALAVASVLPVHNQVGPSDTACALWRHLTISQDPAIKYATARRKLDQAEKSGETRGWLLEIVMDGGIKGT